MDIRLGVASVAMMESFYRECGYRGTVSSSDVNLVALENERVVGAVRLCHEYGHLVLRGMEVAPDRQRQGIGTRLLHFLEGGLANRLCWGIALAHLDAFYGQIGFTFLQNEHAAPPHLIKRIDEYRVRNRERANGKENRIMCRPVP